ncbi:MAG: glycoside hydrolase family 3 protein [Spirochaetaceae bacterium]
MKFKLLAIFITFFIFSCATIDDVVVEPPIIVAPIEKIDIVPIEEPPTEEELLNIRLNSILEDMTLEEKIGQLFIFHIRGYQSVDSNLLSFIKTYKPGGIILFANNINSNSQVLKLVKDLQDSSNIPLFIGVDEEGGIVSRLGKNKNVSVTHLPPALTVGNKNNPLLAYYSGKILGRELSAFGINMDMAPVADVNTNPGNPVIGNRTYSADPHIAGEMVVNVIKGFQEENVISVIKHFPGHGDTNTDSHLGTVISPHGRERLNQIEFIPFIMGIEAGVDAIMTAHMNMPGISTAPLPSTLNPEIITGILRDDLGFNGIIMTDALDMGAITNNFTSSEAVILAIKAGIDMLLIPNNQPNAYKALLSSVQNDEISIDRINESVLRVIKVKLTRGILDSDIILEDLEKIKNDPVHQKLIDSIFSK